MKRGDILYYDTPNGVTVRAMVQTLHRDDTVTVIARQAVNKRFPSQTESYLGYTFRLNKSRLRNGVRK